jgi:LemA protein
MIKRKKWGYRLKIEQKNRQIIIKEGVIEMISFLIVIAVVLLGGVLLYNNLVSLRNKVKEAFSTMDAYLLKRYDLIPNLVETVKGYASHEKETLEGVIKARNMAMQATTVEDKNQAENMITGALKSLFALSEAYPDLKANQNFLALQGDLTKVEEDILHARKYYNAVVRTFNTAIQKFPAVLVAATMGFHEEAMFVAAEEERENVKVQF